MCLRFISCGQVFDGHNGAAAARLAAETAPSVLRESAHFPHDVHGALEELFARLALDLAEEPSGTTAEPAPATQETTERS